MTTVFQPGNQYPVLLGPLADTFPQWMAQRNPSGVLLLTDSNTRKHCLPAFLQASGLPSDTPVVEIPAGETHKHLATCTAIWEQMLTARLDRHALVINLGGGVIGDMGGFCAATWKRGVDFVQVPTTLLSMTDAAIGGKLGIDFQQVKNTIGVFRNPGAVFVDPVFLQTLPERELRSGFAEVIKHALIGSVELWETICHFSPTHLQACSYEDWHHILRLSIDVKVQVVTEDPHEKGIRMLLNYGHTIGHALESYFLETEHPLTHGEAIAIGMLTESWIQQQQLGKIVPEEWKALLLRIFPHQKIPAGIVPEIWQTMLQDKKNKAGSVRMSLPKSMQLDMELVEPCEAEILSALEAYSLLQV
ncbi:MAG: 3-dehydroquinate synthase [Saprospiraceae bacterium]|nr:3-dehydroquinate synthase [Saprospiraceae bacterium]